MARPSGSTIEGKMTNLEQGCELSLLYGITYCPECEFNSCIKYSTGRYHRLRAQGYTQERAIGIIDKVLDTNYF